MLRHNLAVVSLVLALPGCDGQFLNSIDPGGGAATTTVVALKSETAPAESSSAGDTEQRTAQTQPVDVVGRVVADGTFTRLPSRFGKGGAPADPSVCAKDGDIADESLIVNSDGGIANVFVYLDKAPKNAPQEEALVDNQLLDQLGCVFKPHALIVRVGKPFPLKNSDPVTHNVKTNPGKNAASNNSMGGGESMTLNFKKTEKAPFESSCAIHAWMNFYTLVVDHPYAVVTTENGSFTLKNLPIGEHQLRIWHERAGAVETKKVVVSGTSRIDLGDIKIPLSKFKL